MIEVVTNRCNQVNNNDNQHEELRLKQQRKHRSPLQLAIRRFLKNKLAIVGMLF